MFKIGWNLPPNLTWRTHRSKLGIRTEGKVSSNPLVYSHTAAYILAIDPKLRMILLWHDLYSYAHVPGTCRQTESSTSFYDLRTSNSSVFMNSLFSPNRTKWKRQATVGIELLTEAGNIAAMQSLCARLPWMQHPPPPSTLTPPPLSSSLAASLGTNMDLYYRHAAALLRPPFVSSTPSTWIGSLRNEESNEAEENSDKLLENDKS